jgi:hypothetical protein
MATILPTPFKYQATIRNVVYGADSLKLLSEIYCRVRDASGEGCSTFRPVNVREAGKLIGHISYNGRVWDQPVSWGREGEGLWIPLCLDTSKMLFDSRAKESA